MTRDEVLLEIQRRIAVRKGYTDLQRSPPWSWGGPTTGLTGTLHADEGPTVVPRWPQDWCDVCELVEEMRAGGGTYALTPGIFSAYTPEGVYVAEGSSDEEAIARCYCAWQGIDLSDLMEVSDG